jgi:glycerol uptake facilitator-like aquaporin
MALSRKLSAELLGSALLTATVVGSGIMAERLAGGNAALALLANAGATVAVLGALIALLAPISGAHFNPAVTLAATITREMRPAEAIAYVLTQVTGCCLGAMLAHLMFELPLLQTSTHTRSGMGQWLSEFVATVGLLLIALRSGPGVAWSIAAWIGAAYWFTPSTSFANPAITIARSLSDTYAGVRPADVSGFIAAQLAGAWAAVGLVRWLFAADNKQGHGQAHS